jgi:hypothetical protein
VSVSLSTIVFPLVTVAVAPTETVVMSLARVNLRGSRRITTYLSNEDAAQTFSGIVYRRLAGTVIWAASSMPDFSSVGPLGSVMADLDVEGTDELELRGTMSGAGGNVKVVANRKAATP